MMRPARPGEAPLLHGLVQRAYAAYLPLLGRRPAPMDDDYAARIGAGQAWVLERDGAPAALLVLVEAPGHLWLDNIAVEPALHHQGLGRQMMDFALAEARRRGHTEVRLLTNEKMTRNIGVYERYGFREYQRLESGGHRRVYMRMVLD